MTVLMENDLLRQQMAVNAVESSKRFEIQNILTLWKRLFKQLTNDYADESLNHHYYI